MENQTIGGRFKAARMYLRLYQADVSKEINLSQVKISYFETGKKKSLYNEYTDFLIQKGISLEWLLRGEGEMIAKEQKDSNNKNNDYLQLEGKVKILELENKELRIQVAKFQHQIENLTVSLNRFVNFIMDSGVQLLPKQQIVGQQQDFNQAGVSQVLVAMDLINVSYLRKTRTQFAF